DPRAMRTALAKHDATLATAIETSGGWLFKHTGDGVIAAFRHARAAVDAALAAQRRLELPGRMAIATGRVEPRHDHSYGPALNLAARAMAAGHAGQVLVTAPTAAMVTDVDLLDLGEHRLRDLSRAQRLYQLRADGLADRFAPLRTLDVASGN